MIEFSIDRLHAPHRLRRRSFRSADVITDSSRTPACRRAGVSVVSSAFSIRSDRRATSDLSILAARDRRFPVPKSLALA
jgi:hypothetical protein